MYPKGTFPSMRFSDFRTCTFIRLIDRIVCLVSSRQDFKNYGATQGIWF